MTKLRVQILVLVFLLSSAAAFAQGQYRLQLHGVDRDSAYLISRLSINTVFPSRFACAEYVAKLPEQLRLMGYISASIDSIRYDSLVASLYLFAGNKYQWGQLDVSKVEPELLRAAGWNEKSFSGKPPDGNRVTVLQERMLTYLENNGHPFAKVYLDSLQLTGEKVSAQLKVDKGPVYKIDSIRLYGNVKISNNYLQRYLDIVNGSLYSREKLQQVSRKMKELTWVEEESPSNLTMLGTGSVLNMYLKPRKTSQVNVLVGFLPNNDQLSSKKTLITGEANINLRNAFGSGETLGLNWQQLQVKSPRLNILYQHPFLFDSPVGLDFAFDMFRKDSTFLNINFQLGAQYILNTQQSGKIFFQRFQTIVNGANTAFVLQNRRLPDEADVSTSSAGLDYELNNTNYRFNPIKGTEIRVITSVGTKKIRKNNEIMELKDPGDPSFNFGSLYDTLKLKTYIFRIRLSAARYFQAGRQSTVKTALNAGFFQSGNIFRNELFQIGGYRLLRGFDEESQYLSQFAIGTVEYRYLVGQNSFFYALLDAGWGRNNSQNVNNSYRYLGTGLGLAFETRAGVFNIAWAVGKRNDTEFSLRQSKLHFGFINFF